MVCNVRIILARPQEPRNIGASCRAAKNFGITRLDVVPGEPVDWEAAWPLSIGADDVFGGIREFSSLAEAVKDATLVVGATRRLGQRRKDSAWTPAEFASRVRAVAPAEVALVFGNERSGLNDEELAHCSAAVAIDTSPDCPSMNLSHAVAVLCYALSSSRDAVDASHGSGTDSSDERLTRDSLEQLTGEIEEHLHAMQFSTQQGPQGMRAFLNDVFGRASLTSREAHRIRNLFRALSGKKRR